MIKGSVKDAGQASGGFFSRLRKKRIPEILAGFIGGGWLILEFVHWILIDHYHLPENLLDIVFITLLCALFCTLAWRFFGGSKEKRRRFKIELLLIPLFVLIAGYMNIRLISTWREAKKVGGPDAEETGGVRFKPDPTRAVVAAFENMTGDPSLDILGRIAADWVTQGISKLPGIEVSPPALGGSPSANTAVQDLARLTGAGTIITGGYLLDKGSLEFQFQITDVHRSKILQSMTGITGTLASRMDAIELLRRRIMGAMADLFHQRMEIPSVATPPLYEAYREYLLGLDDFGSDYAEADRHFTRASEMDPSFPYPALYMAVGLGNRGEYPKAEEIVRRLDQKKDEFPPFLRHVLDWYRSSLQGHNEDALRSVREARRLFPWSRTLKYIVATTANDANRPLAALDALSAFSREDKERFYREPTGYWFVGVQSRALHVLERHEEELEAIRREKPYFPGILDVRIYEVRALAALGRIEEIAEVVEECLATASVFGTPGEVMLVAAAELREHGTRERSLMYAQRAVQWYRDRMAGRAVPGKEETVRLTEALYAAEQWEEARLIIARELSLKDADDIEPLGLLGALAARLGNGEEALRISERLGAVDRPFLFGRSHYLRARIAALRGERERAVSLLREAFARGLPYGVQVLCDMDLESLRTSGPFKDLVKPRS
ncbi:MAG: transcriptional activator protein [Candidatus Aminicenantes bacterium]|nr:transcriptional activator protein [Candidatus Aminicenantes bacterium]